LQSFVPFTQAACTLKNNNANDDTQPYGRPEARSTDEARSTPRGIYSNVSLLTPLSGARQKKNAGSQPSRSWYRIRKRVGLGSGPPNG
jgi:hypothetical protein